MSIVAIVQARLQSTRLPRKILSPLAGDKTALECMLERVKQSERIDTVVVAASDTPADTELHEFLDHIGQPYISGSEDDVLDRYYTAAKELCNPNDTVVRLTSDCPVIDSRIIDAVIAYHIDGGFDYTSNSLEPYTWPDGMDVEVFSSMQLERVAREATLPSHREHVTFYFWKHPELFRIGYLRNDRPLSSYRLTLDYPGDYEVLKRIYAHFSPRTDFTMDEILAFLDAHPDVRHLNDEVVRNAGWQSALKKDTIGQ